MSYGTGHKVPPLSWKIISEKTGIIRDAMDCKDKSMFPLMPFLEFVLPKMFGVYIDPLEDKDLPDAEALMWPSRKIIQVKESVYYKAIDGDGASRMFLAHEVGHFFMHKDVPYCKNGSPPSRPYEDSEWQANCFAGELLAPAEMLTQYEGIRADIHEVADLYGVSISAAKTQISRAKEKFPSGNFNKNCTAGSSSFQRRR